MNARKLYNLLFDIFQCLSDHVSVIDWELVTVQWFQPLWSGYRLIANTHIELLWYSLNAHRQTHTHRYTYSFRGKIVPSLLISNERYIKKTILFVNSFFYINKKNRVFQLHSVTWYSNGLGEIYTHAWNFGSKLPANGFLIIYGLFIFWT